jgi:hypothetical protein
VLNKTFHEQGEIMLSRYLKSRGTAAPNSSHQRQEALIYCRSVYASMLDWYKVADAKGQLLLTINGIFVTVLSGLVLLRPDELIARKIQIGLAGWIFAAGAATAAGFSIICAIICLHSRLSTAKLDKNLESFQYLDSEGRSQYRPVVTFWFGTLARFRDKQEGLDLLLNSSGEFELSAIADEILLLAPNVLAKHQWANRGWAAAGCALLLTLAAAITTVATT